MATRFIAPTAISAIIRAQQQPRQYSSPRGGLAMRLAPPHTGGRAQPASGNYAGRRAWPG